MPIKKTVYDRGDEKAGHPPREIAMWEIDAREAVKNDPDRFSLKPWKEPGKVSKKDDAAAKASKVAPKKDDAAGDATDGATAAET